MPSLKRRRTSGRLPQRKAAKVSVLYDVAISNAQAAYTAFSTPVDSATVSGIYLNGAIQPSGTAGLVTLAVYRVESSNADPTLPAAHNAVFPNDLNCLFTASYRTTATETSPIIVKEHIKGKRRLRTGDVIKIIQSGTGAIGTVTMSVNLIYLLP